MSVSLHGPVVYIPRRRLTGEAVAATFGGRPPRGSRAVAAFDEDVVTMAVIAGERAQAQWAIATDSDADVGAVFVATSTAPLAEKSTASLVAAALTSSAGVEAVDVAGGLGAGLDALRAACDAVASGRLETALVIAAERRTEPPGSQGELRVGDGAAAVVVVASGGQLAVRGHHAISDVLAVQWRSEGEEFRRSADARFAGVAGDRRLVPAALQAACEGAGWSPSELTAAAAASLDARSAPKLLARAGVSEAAAQPDSLQLVVGHLGAAHGLALLARLAEDRDVGARLGLVAGGDGADAWCFEALTRGQPLYASDAETGGDPLAHYGTYLRGRGLLPESPAVPMEPFTSSAMLQREADAWWRWRGRKCQQCGTVLVLPLPACHHCRGERFESVALQRNGTVFTVTAEHYMPSPEPPTGMVVVDLDGGGRATVQWAGGAGAVPSIGDQVQLVLRKYHEAEGLPHYWWKAVPA